MGGHCLFPIQIVVTKELDGEEHAWLKALSRKVEEEAAKRLLKRIKDLTEKEDKDMADSVLRVMLEANGQIVEKWKGDADIFEALMEIMEPQIQMREKKVWEYMVVYPIGKNEKRKGCPILYVLDGAW